MRNIPAILLFLAATILSGFMLSAFAKASDELNRLPQSTGFTRNLNETERYKLFLLEEVRRQKLAYRDFAILREVIRCESEWRQFRKDGSAIMSFGNIGLGQINRLAHERTYKAMKLDMKNPYDNLRFAVHLYQRDGLKPWEAWSGHCWQKRIVGY